MTAPTRPRTSEKVWMAQVIDLAKMLGFECYHTHDSRRSTAGFPDLCMVRPPRVVYAELKTETGKTTAAQDHWLDILARSGHETYVWRPQDLDDIAHLLRRGETEPAKGYDIALRAQQPGSELMDDIVVRDVEMFRAEDMSGNSWWVCCYLRNGERITWDVRAKSRPTRIEWTTVELPGGDFTYEPRPEPMLVPAAEAGECFVCQRPFADEAAVVNLNGRLICEPCAEVDL